MQRVPAYASRRLDEVESPAFIRARMLGGCLGREDVSTVPWDRHFKVVTDNSALQWLQKKQHLRPKSARWPIQRQEYDFTIRHRSRLRNRDTEFLSRHPLSRGAVAHIRTLRSRYDEVRDIVANMQLQTSATNRHQRKHISRLRRAYQVVDVIVSPQLGYGLRYPHLDFCGSHKRVVHNP